MCAGSSSTGGEVLSFCGTWWVMPEFPVSVSALQVIWTRVKQHEPGFSSLSRLQTPSNATSFSFLGHLASSLFSVSLHDCSKIFVVVILAKSTVVHWHHQALGCLYPANLLAVLPLLDPRGQRRSSYIGEFRKDIPDREGV